MKIIYERIYEKLMKIINLDELKQKKSLKLRTNWFMDLTIEFLNFENNSFVILLAHYFVQNGDEYVLCLYYENDSRKHELINKYSKNKLIKNTYWKYDRSTSEGIYSIEFLDLLTFI